MSDSPTRNSDDFASLDDSALLGWRAEARAELGHLPENSPEFAVLARAYDASLEEVVDRARRAWSRIS